MEILFDSCERLWAEGQVVWGYLIQANQNLFDPSESDDCPALLVYSADSETQVSPLALQPIATQIFALKGSIPDDPALRNIAALVTDELARPLHVPIPQALCGRTPCAMGVTFVARKNLPVPYLCNLWMPVVVLPTAPYIAMPLPDIFWPPQLHTSWAADSNF